MRRQYQFIVWSVEALVQQVACAYMRHGYLWYVTGFIPAGKDPSRTDAKLIGRYNIGVSRRRMARLKAIGESVQHYLRIENTYGGASQFVILASKGTGEFWEHEKPRHFRFHPLVVGPYQIGLRHGRGKKVHAWVALSDGEYEALKALALDLALRKSARRVAGWFFALPYPPYWGVNRQLHKLLRLVNKKRKTAGLELVGRGCIKNSRTSIKPFEPPEQKDTRSAA